MLTRSNSDRKAEAILRGYPAHGEFAPSWVHEESAFETNHPQSGEDAPPITGEGDYGPGGNFELDPTPSMEVVLAPVLLELITPARWRGTTAEPLRWLALNRIPAGDVTILSSDGGGGKTTIALQLCVAVERDLGDWLGTTVEAGPVLFVSAEEDQHEIRRRIERICRGRGIDPHISDRLHLHFPDLETSLLASAGKGPLQFTDLHRAFVATVDRLRPVLVVIDAVAAVFGGDHRDRAQVRAFMSAFRKLAMRTGAAIVFLDHPSVSGMAEGSGRAGSVDWNNTVRSRLYMSSVADDNDARELEVKKANRGPKGEKIPLRWVDGAFVVEGAATPIERQAADAAVDDLFLRLLDKRNAQGRGVGPKPGRNYAPAELAKDPEAGGVKAKAFEASMERLFTVQRIRNVTFGPPSRAVTRIERGSA